MLNVPAPSSQQPARGSAQSSPGRVGNNKSIGGPAIGSKKTDHNSGTLGEANGHSHRQSSNFRVA